MISDHGEPYIYEGIYMGCPIKEGNPTAAKGGEPLVGGLGILVRPWLLHLSLSQAHSISFLCHPLIVSTASAGIMYIVRMLLLGGQLQGDHLQLSFFISFWRALKNN